MSSKLKINVGYKGKIIGQFRADFVVDKKIIVELKATRKLREEEEAQLIHYLHATGMRLGLLFNFGTPTLEKVRRIV